MPRKTKTGRRTTSRWQKTTSRVARPWSREEVAFMRKFYKKFETAWVARQLGRTVYSIRYKAVDLCIKKANPSIWRGNKGPANSFRLTSKRRPTTRRAKTTRKPATRRGYRANNKRKVTRKATPRRTVRRRTR